MYTWVFRDKGSEWRAISRLQMMGHASFRPLVEAACEPLMPRLKSTAKTPQQTMIALGSKLQGLALRGSVWVDLSNLSHLFGPSDRAQLSGVLRTALGSDAAGVTPVIRTSSDILEIEAAILWARSVGSGLAIRIDGLTSVDEKARTVAAIAKESQLPMEMIDLIADAQDLPLAVTHEELVNAFPLSQEARCWTLVAGSFPRAITHLSPAIYEHNLARAEWDTYQKEVQQDVSWRRPEYGDYATQPAIYAPSPPFRASPSVRYTSGSGFVVLRGTGGKGSDFSQYIGHARFLQGQAYFGDICRGEAESYVGRIASGSHGTGNATTWRIASLQRHVEVASVQVGALPGVVSNCLESQACCGSHFRF